jgi:hypothetical protein
VKDYDTYAGIAEAIKTLEGFNKLIAERHEAGYQRKESLKRWILFDGAVMLDGCGGTGRSRRTVIEGDLFRIEDFNAMAERLDDEVKGRGFMHYSMGDLYPMGGMVCPVCGSEWTTENFLESYAVRESTYMSKEDADPLAGQTLGQLQAAWSTPEKTVWLQVRRGKEESLDPDLRLQKGDALFVDSWRFFHPECLRLKVTCEEHIKFDNCLDKAGFKCRLFTPVKNEYWSYPDSSLWFEVQTEFVRLKIGWRKRVINVEYPAEIGCLTEDGVTKGTDHFHAWGYEKLTEYLTEMYQRCKKSNFRQVQPV